MKFKTNINCGNCVNAVTPILNSNEQIKNWSVDTDNPDKVLTIEGENIDTEALIASLNKVGYKAEPIN